MYQHLLIVHSWYRWLLLAALCFALYRGYSGWLRKKAFSGVDDKTRFWTVIIAHIQLLIGYWLYAISPIVSYFLHNFRDAVRQRDARFFGMEHITVMTIAVIVLTVGSALVKRKATDEQKFKTMAIWFTVALLLILSSIPWSFSPFTHRALLPTP